MTSAVSGGSVRRVEVWIGARRRAKAVGLAGQARGNQNDRSWGGALETRHEETRMTGAGEGRWREVETDTLGGEPSEAISVDRGTPQ